MLEDDSPKLVLEPLNRYENHLVNTIGSALKFVAEVGSPKVGVMGDSFHMNIEEANSSAALEEAGNRLWHFHFSDNTRQAPGMGNQNLEGILRGLLELGYKGTITMEFVPQWYDERGIARRSREMADFESMAALAIANLKNLERKVRE